MRQPVDGIQSYPMIDQHYLTLHFYCFYHVLHPYGHVGVRVYDHVHLFHHVHHDCARDGRVLEKVNIVLVIVSKSFGLNINTSEY